VPALSTTELQRLLGLAEVLLDVRDEAGVAGTLLGAVAETVGSDTATLTHLDLRTQHEVAILWPRSRPVATVLAAYPRLGHTHPLRRPAAQAWHGQDQGRPVPVRISDVLPARAWRSTALRTEAMPDVTDQMAVPLARHGPVLHALTLSRTSGTFTDRQRDVLHQGSAHVRAAVARSARGEGVGLRLAPDPQWVPLATAPGYPRPLAPAARALRVEGSAADAASGHPSREAGQQVALSNRERQVLGLVAEGLTDAQVARRLGLQPATVSRHLHRVYTRHGVANRAAAVRLLASSG
jgi:DNA-binding CsgD family transcriptional regulator